MKVKKKLWTYKPHDDGTCDIKIYVYHNGKQRNFSTGFSIRPEDWDEKKQLVKKTHPLANAYNTAIRSFYLELEEHFVKGGNFKNFRKGRKTLSLIEYCQRVIKKWDDGLLPMAKNTIKNYRATLRRLIEYQEYSPQSDLSLNEIDMEFYHQFSDFLSKHANCRLPGISKHIKIIKRLMGMSLEEGIHNNTVFKKKAFKRPRPKPSSKIYLSVEDLEKLEQLKLSAQPILERERDRFLLAYWFLMRFSDVNRISEEMLFTLNGNQFLRYQSMKTKVEATLPVKESAPQDNAEA